MGRCLLDDLWRCLTQISELWMCREREREREREGEEYRAFWCLAGVDSKLSQLRLK